MESVTALEAVTHSVTVGTDNASRLAWLLKRRRVTTGGYADKNRMCAGRLYYTHYAMLRHDGGT